MPRLIPEAPDLFPIAGLFLVGRGDAGKLHQLRLRLLVQDVLVVNLIMRRWAGLN